MKDYLHSLLIVCIVAVVAVIALVIMFLPLSNNTQNLNSASSNGQAIAILSNVKLSISIVSPSDAGTINGFANLQAETNKVSNIQFKIDGLDYDRGMNTQSYSSMLDTKLLANGQHAITAIAKDSSGDITTSIVIVNVQN